MALENAREFLKLFNMDHRIIEHESSTATVEEAAETNHCAPAQIAKSLTFKTPDNLAIMIVVSGDAKVDNQKFRETFGFKSKMLSPQEVIDLVHHEIGGVCPFGIPKNVKVYTDISLQRFATVLPAAGSDRSCIEMTCDELYKAGRSKGWVDVCKAWQETIV